MAVEQLQAVKPAALQPDIEENQIRPPRGDGRKRAVAVRGRARAIALVLQNARDELPDVVFVVDYKNIRCHVLMPARGFGDRSFRGRGVGDLAGGETQPHPGAARARRLFRRVMQFDAAAMLFQNLAHDSET